MRLPRLAAATVLVLAAACGGAEPEPEPVVGAGTEVSVEPARLALLRQVVTANGEVTPQPDADWTVHASETAMIAQLPFEEGAPVATGDIVVRFEVPSRSAAIQAAEFDLTIETTRRDRASNQVKELTTLFQNGLAARVDLDAAKSELAAAESAVATLTATLNGLRSAEASDVVRARFSGIVLKRWHYQGDLVMATGSDPVLRIVDPSRSQVTLEVPVNEASLVTPGQRVAVNPMSLTPTIGTVSTVMLATSTQAPTTKVIVQLPPAPATPPPAPDAEAPPGTGPPRVGEAVIGEILIAEVPEALVVPTRAILRTTGSPYVLVAGSDGRVVRRELRLGASTADLTQVLEGIQLGEFVITSALTELAEGDLVRHR